MRMPRRCKHPYAGQSIALATKHEKHHAIAPPLARTPGLTVVVPDGLDTDQLGTFTGEIARPGPPRDTAVLKAQLGLRSSGLPRALASEGSFGPHPHAFFVPSSMEILALVDQELDIKITEQQLSTRTNFAHHSTSGLDTETRRFLDRVGFPDHALIARRNHGAPDEPIIKGIRTLRDLEAAVSRAAAASEDGLARLETDMRAHHNPTRMRAIATLADQLANRLTRLCDSCGTPGYGPVDAKRGLPCAACHTPTEWIAIEIHACARCDHRTHQPRSDHRTAADPAHCPTCNP